MTDETKENCFQTVSGVKNCNDDDPDPCNVFVTASTSCVDNNTYNVLLNISGTGSFTVDDGINPPLTGQSAGTATVGPIPNGNYNITVTDETKENCFQSLSGTKDCSNNPPNECNLTAVETPVCVDGGEYELNLAISGGGNVQNRGRY